MVQLVFVCSEEVGGAEDVGCVVGELEVMVEDGVVDVVGFDEVFQRARPFLWLMFDIMNGHWLKVESSI